MGTDLRDEAWRALHQQLRGIAKRRAALDAEEARCLRAAEHIRLWRRLGYVHMNEYLERELGYGPQVGIERLRVARELAALPQIEACLAEGALAYSAVRELTRIATPETERAWLDNVHGKNLRQIEALVAGKQRGDRPEDPSNPDLIRRVMRLELTPAVFALFRQVQSAMADEHGGRLDDSALVEVLCRRALEGDGSSERPAYQIALTVCESCRRGWQNGAGREIEVGPEVVERARCDAELLGSVDAKQPERLTATVTPRIRRQVLARDHHRCTAPGCRSARNLDLHHIEYQCEGGANELGNLTALCSGHHQLLHEGLLAIRGTAPHALEFVWRDAEVVGPVVADRAATVRHEPRPGCVEAGAMGGEPREPRSAPANVGTHVEDGASVSARAVDGDAHEEAGVLGGQGREARAAVANGGPHVGDRAVGSSGRSGSPAIDGDAPVASCTPRGEARAAVDRGGPHVGAQIHAAPEGLAPLPAAVDDASDIDGDARVALVTAGYSPREARTAVENAHPQVGDHATLEQVIYAALRCCIVTGRHDGRCR